MKISCGITNGIKLALYEMRDVGMGIKEARATGESLTIPGPLTGGTEGHTEIVSEVDDAFMTKWFEQNKDSPLVTGNLIHRLQDKDEGK